MVGKRTPMKTDCNGLQDTNCMDSWPFILEKLGFRPFQKRTIHYGERKHDGVEFQRLDELRKDFLRKRFVPLFYPFVF